MALCPSCGDEIFGGKVCYRCGASATGRQNTSPPIATSAPLTPQQQPAFVSAQQGQYGYPHNSAPMQPTGTNGLAIASLVCAFIFPLLGVIFGHIALNQINKTGQDGGGMAKAGLIIGYLSMFFFFLILV